MNNNYKKTVFGLSLAAFLVVKGCGSSSGNNAGGNSHGANATGESTDAKKVTLKFMTQSSPLAPTDPNEKLIFKRMEEKTGIHIDWTNYTNDVFAEKKNLALASGD